MISKIHCFFVCICLTFFSLNAFATNAKTIGIIASEDDELQPLKLLLPKESSIKISNFEFIESSINNNRIIMVKSGIGKVNSAIAASFLISNYNPDFLLIIGTSGALSNKLKPKDIIVSTETSFNDVDVTQFHYKYGQIPGLPWKFKGSTQLINIIKKLPNDNINYGLIISGDRFVAKNEQKKFLTSKFKNVLAVDMETASIGQVAYIFNIPFLGIKAISDAADENAKTNYEQNAKSASTIVAELVVEILKKI